MLALLTIAALALGAGPEALPAPPLPRSCITVDEVRRAFELTVGDRPAALIFAPIADGRIAINLTIIGNPTMLTFVFEDGCAIATYETPL